MPRIILFFLHPSEFILTFCRRPGIWIGCGMQPRYRFATTLTIRKIWNHSAIYSYGRSSHGRGAILMRILYCNKYNYRFSGTEVYLFELMELMRSQGHEVALFSMADPRGEPTPYDQHFVPHI